LKATIATDNILRIYECLEQPTLSSWQLIDEIDIANIAPGPSPTHVTRAQTAALATPTQTHATLDGASATLVAQALRETQQASSVPPSRAGLGNREADGGWTLSWCKDPYWGEIIAAGAGNNGVVKIIQLNSRRSHVLFTLEGSASTGFAASSNPSQAGGNDLTQQGAPASLASYSVTSVAWAPSCGRSYHLIATAGRDGHVRIWKLKPPPEDMGDDDAMHEDGKWTATSVGDFDHHKYESFFHMSSNPLNSVSGLLLDELNGTSQGSSFQPLSCISRLMYFTELSCLQLETMGESDCGKPLPTMFGDWQVVSASSRRLKSPLDSLNPKMSTWRTEVDQAFVVPLLNLILLLSGSFWRVRDRN
jgi:hypothetical protein